MVFEKRIVKRLILVIGSVLFTNRATTKEDARQMNNNYDAIIIGSGIGGLTCGNLLAKNGMKILIVEQHYKPGGYCTSYQRDGCTFDVPLIIGNMRKGDPIKQLFSYIGVSQKVKFLEIDKLAKIVGPDLTIDWHADTYKLEYEFISKFPEERKTLRKFFRAIRKLWDEMMEAHYQPNLFQMSTYPFRFPGLVKYQHKTLAEFFDQFFKNEKLKEFLGQEAITLGLSANRVSALFYIGYIMSYAVGGIWYPEGGFQKISDALADCFQDYGGTLMLKTKVRKIVVKAKQAKGVELEDGEKIFSKQIISNADTKRTFLDLIGSEKLKTKFAHKIETLEQSISGFVVNLGVRMEIPQLLNYAWLFHFPEYGSTENMLELNALNQMNLEKYSFSIDTSTLIQGASSKGVNTISLVLLPAPYNYKNKWQSDNKVQYKQLKEEVADNLIKKAEKFIPSLSQNIVVKDISTPLTYEKYTSATEGGWYDVAVTPQQAVSNRLGPETSIKGLYLTGAKTMLGPGLTGAIPAGLYTADMILKGKLTGGKSHLKEELLK